MSTPPGPEKHEAPEPWQQVDRIVLEFERAWRAGRRPALEAFVPAAGPDRQAVLVELIHVDLERRLKAGEAARVEEYLDRFAELAADTSVVLDLIAAEFQWRRLGEPELGPAEYSSRFPQLASQLAGRLSESPAVAEAPASPASEDPQSPLNSEPNAGAQPVTPVSLLQRLCRTSRQEDWERFVQLFTPLLFRWARRLGLQEHDASDLVQDVFTLLVRKLPEFTYDRHRSFRAWLHTVLRNKWRDHCKRPHGPELVADADLTAVPGRENLEDLWEADYRQHLVQQVLRVMQAEFQPTTWKACWEFVVGGRPAADVAAELGISENAVYIAKCRVLRRLRQELAGLLD